jgi:hypothetical protein
LESANYCLKTLSSLEWNDNSVASTKKFKLKASLQLLSSATMHCRALVNFASTEFDVQKRGFEHTAKKDSPVHIAPACTRSKKGSMHTAFPYISVRGSFLDLNQ